MESFKSILEPRFFSYLWETLLLIPTLIALHYCLFHTKIPYKTIKLAKQYLPVLLLALAFIVITFYYWAQQ